MNDRYWLLTWTTYGNWLPGDSRGFVSQMRDEHELPYIHNAPGTSYDENILPLERAMRDSMLGSPVRLNHEQADAILVQFQQTAAYRGWQLCAVSIMANHIHIVVGVFDNPPPEKVLHDFKSYAGRILNQRWGKPTNGTWWTESGSRRKLADNRSIFDAIRYVKHQEHALAVWISELVDAPDEP